MDLDTVDILIAFYDGRKGNIYYRIKPCESASIATCYTQLKAGYCLGN